MAMFATTYYRLLRVGEVTKGAHPIVVNDVNVSDNKKKFLIVLRSSKMHTNAHKPQTISIVSTPRGTGRTCYAWKNELCSQVELCPFKLLQDYIKARGPASHIQE